MSEKTTVLVFCKWINVYRDYFWEKYKFSTSSRTWEYSNVPAFDGHQFTYMSSSNSMWGFTYPVKLLFLYGWQERVRKEGMNEHIKNLIFNHGATVMGDREVINDEEWEHFQNLEKSFSKRQRLIIEEEKISKMSIILGCDIKYRFENMDLEVGK